jgi:hypothetical protein
MAFMVSFNCWLVYWCWRSDRFIIYDKSRVFKGERFKKIYRGTELVRARTLADKTRERGVNQLTVANIPIPTYAENLHFSIAGTTGTGKPQFSMNCYLRASLEAAKILL